MLGFSLRLNAAGLAAWMLYGLSAAPVQAMDQSALTVEVRLLTAVTSRMHQTEEVEAELMRPVIVGGHVRMPTHSRLFGHVLRAKSVGLGLRHERAFVDLQFTEWQTPSGERQPLDATPSGVDNAREQVTGGGRIQGILAASNPLGIARGLWFRPSAHVLLKPLGLVGASGTTFHLEMHPIGAAGLLVARIALTRLPEPEIDLPAGTEMMLQLNCAALNQSWGVAPEPVSLDDSLSEFLTQQPVSIRKADGTLTADLINVALIGSAETLSRAFAEAGWSQADRLNKTSFAQTYKAFTQRHGYAEAPVSKLYYEGREPDLVFQKSLNSIAKRHHVRLWRVTGPGGESIWLGAATHDITVGFDAKTFGLLHKIDENIDRERRKVIADLEFIGASSGASDLTRNLRVGAETKTDQVLAVARIDMPGDYALKSAPASAGGSRIRRFTRRLILEARQYALRENPYYLAFASVRKLTRQQAPVVEAGDFHSVLPSATAVDAVETAAE